MYSKKDIISKAGYMLCTFIIGFAIGINVGRYASEVEYDEPIEVNRASVSNSVVTSPYMRMLDTFDRNEYKKVVQFKGIKVPYVKYMKAYSYYKLSKYDKFTEYAILYYNECKKGYISSNSIAAKYSLLVISRFLCNVTLKSNVTNKLKYITMADNIIKFVESKVGKDDDTRLSKARVMLFDGATRNDVSILKNAILILKKIKNQKNYSYRDLLVKKAKIIAKE